LVCANYLGKENKKVLVLERRGILGGAACSEELFPGYVFSSAAQVLSMFRKQIIDDIFPEAAVWKKDLVLYSRDYSSFTPTREEGKYLLLSSVDNKHNFN
jgi:phytoene dehydrogenase-like protein